MLLIASFYCSCSAKLFDAEGQLHVRKDLLEDPPNDIDLALVPESSVQMHVNMI